ncbi:hypothetical protein DUI87_21515 [Hirundo rustica rustica]|uniref:Glypican-3 beta subunit n=1 Tax=Hirundo rustica rustica TaxID=333673 RepID=A0A3M0JMZ9_HIRRU|nr:hypothetical protein DUI87_21515 [Hirundo rustica rustica]
MAAGGSRAVLGLWLLAAGLCGAAAAGRSPSCHEVRTAFQLRQIGPLKLVPDVPTAESDLQICQHRAPTCCTKKMEESYQAAVRRERTQSIQALNFELKYMIAGHITAFQEDRVLGVHLESHGIPQIYFICQWLLTALWDSGFWDRGRIAGHFESAGKEEKILGLPSEVLEEIGEIMFLKVNSQCSSSACVKHRWFCVVLVPRRFHSSFTAAGLGEEQKLDVFKPLCQAGADMALAVVPGFIIAAHLGSKVMNSLVAEHKGIQNDKILLGKDLWRSSGCRKNRLEIGSSRVKKAIPKSDCNSDERSLWYKEMGNENGKEHDGWSAEVEGINS